MRRAGARRHFELQQAAQALQYLLSDALGLTAIHLNRVLQQLRERGLMTMKENHVLIHDVKGLTQIAGYDNAYLDQPRPSVEADS